MRKVNVVNDGLVLAPLRLDRVGSGKNGGAGVQLADDACFGDTQCLLLHHLVQHTASRVVHFVKLVNAADTIVCQHQGTTVKRIIYLIKNLSAILTFNNFFVLA